MEIVDTIYSVINAIGREKIQRDITSDIGLSRHYIKMIMTQCEKITGPTEAETVGALSEALLHFMLTVSTLPSSRKVPINSIDLNIVIPNVYTLQNSPDKAIIILLSKDNNNIMQEQLSNLASIQPNYRNLWIISSKPLLVECINYIINPEKNAMPSSEKRNFHDIIMDIDKFLEETGDRSLRLFQ